MSNQQGIVVPARTGVIAALGELIEALDRRVPHIERAGELRIAADAATLRSEAVARIAELKRADRTTTCRTRNSSGQS